MTNTTEKISYIKFFAPINGNTTNSLMNVVDQAVNQGATKVALLISSGGGTVFHGISVFNYLVGLPIEIDTHNFGSVDSIGVVIFLAGKKRMSVPDARFLIHTVTTSFSANMNLEEQTVVETLKSMRIDIDNIANIIAKGTNKTRDQVKEDMSARTTLNADQAKSYGLVHEIRKELIPQGAQIISINAS